MRFHIAKEYGMDSTALYLLSDDGKMSASVGDGGLIVWKERKQVEEVDPLCRFTWNEREWDVELLKALSELGTKLPDQGFIAGELAATKSHLQDMRSLVFEKSTKRNYQVG